MLRPTAERQKIRKNYSFGNKKLPEPICLIQRCSDSYQLVNLQDRKSNPNFIYLLSSQEIYCLKYKHISKIIESSFQDLYYLNQIHTNELIYFDN